MHKSKKINIITLGCSKNVVDSELLMGQLRANHVEVVHNSNEPAHAVVINTCGFINDAKEESIDTILQNIEVKKAGLVNKVYVMGCLSQRYRKDLEREIDHVDGFYGTNELTRIVGELGATFRTELIGERVITTPAHYAYLKISEGCDRTCSFCAIPLIRGKHRSKPVEDILKEAEQLVEGGVKEIILIAQDLTYYGVDLYAGRELSGLLEKLASIPGLDWIRLQYNYPADFPVGLLNVINNHPNICKYIDIPLQHINDRILMSMRRNFNKKRTLQLLDAIREKIPGVAIRTTMIVGYPGETDEDFRELMSFVKDQAFDRLGVFTYSHEEDTRAYRLQDNIPEPVKLARMEELMNLQQDISLIRNNSRVGSVMKVLIDRQEEDYFVGRTEFDSPEVDNEVLIKPSKGIRIGQFYDVRITSADFFDLYAEGLRD